MPAGQHGCGGRGRQIVEHAFVVGIQPDAVLKLFRFLGGKTLLVRVEQKHQVGGSLRARTVGRESRLAVGNGIVGDIRNVADEIAIQRSGRDRRDLICRGLCRSALARIYQC
jgi:hypothetical protein